MVNFLDPLLVLVLVLNLLILGTSRLVSVIRTVALQGALLGTIPLLVHEHVSLPVVLTALGAVTIKGFVIPAIMLRALRRAHIKREVEPLVGLLPSIVLGALATVFAFFVADQLPLVDAHNLTLVVPTSLACVLVGFILLTSRFKALSQVVGYLILENGIFVFGMLLLEAMPLVVEMGVLLDLFVGVFVISIIVNHVSRAFASMDTRRLAALKE